MINNVGGLGYWLIVGMFFLVIVSLCFSVAGFVFVLIDSWNKRKKISNWRKILVSTGFINAAQPIIVGILSLVFVYFNNGFIEINIEWIFPMFVIIPGAIFWLGMPVLNAIVYFVLEKKEKTIFGWLATITYAGVFVCLVMVLVLFLIAPDQIGQILI